MCEKSQNDYFEKKPTSLFEVGILVFGLLYYGLVIVVISAITPFTDFYPAFDLASFAWAPNPDFAIFWFAAVTIIMTVEMWLIKMAVDEVMAKFMFFPTSTCVCC